MIVSTQTIYMQLVEIFRAGTHIDSAGNTRTFGETELDQIAGSYNPSTHTAPFLEGHDESKPNHGLVSGLVRMGQSLYAQAGNLADGFREAISSRRLPALSAALYHPDDARNPTPGSWALRHVAAVQIPAVKGMEPPAFNEADCFIQFSEPVILLGEAPSMPEPLGQAPPAEGLTDIAKREAALLAREAMLNRAEFDQFAESLLKGGKQFDKDRAIAIFMGLPGTGEIEFAEGQKLDPRAAFKSFLEALPKSVDFSERAPSGGPVGKDINPNEIASLAIAYKAEAEAKGLTISFSEAVNAVMGAPA
jgi:hypothetical protein